MASSAKRVAEHRSKLRAQGLRPVQIWVPDTRAPGFMEEARAWALSLHGKPEEDDYLKAAEKALAETEGWVWEEDQ